jgi:hypothetical protein
VLSPIYSEAGAIEEEREKEDEEELCWGSVLDNTQSPMICAIVLCLYQFTYIPSFVPLFELCVETTERSFEKPRPQAYQSKVTHQLRLDALQKVDQQCPPST